MQILPTTPPLPSLYSIIKNQEKFVLDCIVTSHKYTKTFTTCNLCRGFRSVSVSCIIYILAQRYLFQFYIHIYSSVLEYDCTVCIAKVGIHNFFVSLQIANPQNSWAHYEIANPQHSEMCQSANRESECCID